MSSLKVSASLPIEYSFFISENTFSLDNDTLMYGRDERSSSCLVCVDENVYNLYEREIVNYFSNKTQSYKILIVHAEEKNKGLEQFLTLFDAINNYPINRRNEPVIIIGGGVATDITAFATSCFRRGIPHIKVPTTLMGYVDASVGIKTGINYHSDKNRMGSFYPPLSVVLDKSFFRTQSDRDIANGVGEIIKIAVIKNKRLFTLLERNASRLVQSKFQCAESDEILQYAISDMIEELQPNLFEDNLQRSVDFGHTFSLAFEMNESARLKHGEAVAMDVLFSTYLAWGRGLVTKEEFFAVYDLMQLFSLPIKYALFNPDLLWKSLCERVLHRDGYQHIPVPNSIGQCQFLNDVTYDELVSICHGMQSLNKITQKDKEEDEISEAALSVVPI